MTVQLLPQPGRPLVSLTVEDNCTEGFRNLDHAFTLFADSYKKDLPEKRGRFNLGEKLMLAVCQEARLSITTGTVTFEADGSRHVSSRHKRAQGSDFAATLRMTRSECDDACTTCGES